MRKSTSKKSNIYRRKKSNFVLKLVVIILIFIVLIFAVDYCSTKTNIHNSATDTVHEVKTQIQDSAMDVMEDILPKEKNAEENAGSTKKAAESEPDIYIFPENLELPVCAASKNGTAPDHQIRRFKNYVVCYRESYEQAEWAAYCLEKEELVKNASRGDDFRADPEITTGSATLADYKKSGYDRGHLAPAADFAFSEEAMSESFFLSNMSPQAPGLNREIWQYLEGQVRTWADRFGKVYVITGPVLEKPAEAYDSIGENQVSIPEFYYKVLLVPTHESLMSIGFIIPNKKCKDTFWDYAVTIDEVERRTGLDFYSLLDDHLEDKLESEYALENWK